jgi:hypothetical protein
MEQDAVYPSIWALLLNGNGNSLWLVIQTVVRPGWVLVFQSKTLEQAQDLSQGTIKYLIMI